MIVARELSNVSLSVNAETDELAYAPNGVVADALPVGSHTVTVALTETGLLGTVLLEFSATVHPRGLDADRYGLSAAPAKVTIAAGAGAVGEALARVSLSADADGAIVVLPEAFPGEISLGLEGESSVAVFYLTAAVSGGDEFVRTANLTVTLDANHISLEQAVALTVSALRTPPRADVIGRIPPGGAYEETSIHGLQERREWPRLCERCFHEDGRRGEQRPVGRVGRGGCLH